MYMQTQYYLDTEKKSAKLLKLRRYRNDVFIRDTLIHPRKKISKDRYWKHI